MSKIEKFRKDHMMKLQGKEYLPVAARVFQFRQEHPTAVFFTEPVEIDGNPHMRATIDIGGVPVAMAHKRIKKDGRGPAAQYPVETAETGAIGRALAFIGYGTLSGDLDEGDQLADAPVEREEQAINQALDDVLIEVSKCNTMEDVESNRSKWRGIARALNEKDRAKLADAVTSKLAEVAHSGPKDGSK